MIVQLQQMEQQYAIHDKQLSLIYSQVKAIMINNLIFNHRSILFLKEMVFVALCLGCCILQIQITTKLIGWTNETRQTVITYSFIVVLFLSRSCVMVHWHNRNRFVYFQKAYGMNSFVYLMIWIFYSLVIGALKFLIYNLLLYSYLQPRFGYVFKDYPPGTVLQYSQLCLASFLSFFSFYSYCLFGMVIISHNQIGIKILTPLLLIGFLNQTIGIFSEFSKSIFIYSSPSGWLSNISFYNQLRGNNVKFNIQQYTKIFLYQFFIPLISAIIIELVKIHRFEIKYLVTNLFRQSVKSEEKSTIYIELIRKTGDVDNTHSNPPILIQIQNLSKKKGKKILLDSLNASIKRGEMIILFGKNGSGKSTLIRILTNVEYISSGKIIRQKLLKFGVSFQQNFFQQKLTVKQNLVFYARLKGIKLSKTIVDNLLLRFELNQFSDKNYQVISGGSKRKLSIACAFLGNNDIIFLDEPTIGLDFKVKKEIQNIIIRQKLRNNHPAIFITTVDPDLEFLELADRFWVFHKGKIIFNERINVLENSDNLIIMHIKLVDQLHSNLENLCAELEEKQKIAYTKQNQILTFHFKQERLMPVFEIVDKYKCTKHLSISISKVKDKIEKYLKEFNCDQQQESFIAAEQSIVEFNNKYLRMQRKQTFIQLLISCLIIQYYAIMPTIIDKLYYLLILFISLGYQLWMLIHVDSKYKYQVLFSFFFYSYPFLFLFIYIHVITSHVENRPYQNVIFKMGMKRIPFWIAAYIFNITIIYLPMLVVVQIIQTRTQVDMTLYNTFCFIIANTALMYFTTLFFSSWFLGFSFFSLIYMIIISVTNIPSIISNYTEKPFQDYNLAIKCFLPSFNFINSQKHIQVYFSLVQTFIYLLLFFLLSLIYFKYKNYQQKMNVEDVKQNQYEGGIEEKLRVQNIIETNIKSEVVQNAVILQNVYLKYSKKVTKISGLNLAVKKGAIFGLMGMNGSGKSTTIKMMINQLFRTVGNIFFEGVKIDSQTSDIYEEISLSPQSNYLIEFMTVRHHLDIICALKGVAYRLHKPLIQSILDIFEMGQLIDEPISHLSGGTKKKLIVISSIITRPKYLFLDQPTLGLDDDSQRKFSIILKILQQYGTTTILISHRINEIQNICTDVGILKKGNLIMTGCTNEMVADYSQGYKITIRTMQIGAIRQSFKFQLNKEIKIFGWVELQQRNIIEVFIPNERFNLRFCLDILSESYHKKEIHGYQISKQNLTQVFNYLYFENTQQSRINYDQL